MEIAFDKTGGLVPAIIQDEATGEVLMLGFMNAESFESTRSAPAKSFSSRAHVINSGRKANPAATCSKFATSASTAMPTRC